MKTHNSNTLILIIEDDTISRMVLRATLEKEGYEVIEAASGETGINLFSRFSEQRV